MSILSTYPPMRGLANVPWYFGLLNAGPNTSSPQSISTQASPTASSTTHTKGGWTQMTASLATECGLLLLNVREVNLSNTETSILLDIGTGAAGSETVIVQNLAVGGAQAGGNAGTAQLLVWVPVRIAAGTRVAARIQAAIASDSAVLGFSYYGFAETNALVPTSVDVLGTSTTTSRGTVMSGASGTYVEIVASTDRQYRAVVIVPSVPTNNVTTARVVKYTAAVGAAGAETDLGSTYADYSTTEAVRSFAASPSLPIACNVPAGSRLSVKHDIAANPGDHACCLIGVP